nr:hypothetical protein [Candidatus Freyrarchaeum guaymaensis]
MVDECVWMSAAESDYRAQEVLLRAVNKGYRIVFDANGILLQKLSRKLKEAAGKTCAAYLLRFLNTMVRSHAEYREPVKAAGAPRENMLIAGIAVTAGALITEDKELKEWFKREKPGTIVLSIDEALLQL